MLSKLSRWLPGWPWDPRAVAQTVFTLAVAGIVIAAVWVATG